MGKASNPALAAAVSNAGGFGIRGLAGHEAGTVGRLIWETHELTDRPFGANFLLSPQEQTEVRLKACLEAGVAVGLELADPVVVGAYVDDLKKLLDESSIMEQRAFLRSFVRGVEVGESDLRLLYTIPVPCGSRGGGETEEVVVLPIIQSGSPDRSPTEPSDLASNANSPASSNSATVKQITAPNAAPRKWSPNGGVSWMKERLRTEPSWQSGWASPEPASPGP